MTPAQDRDVFTGARRPPENVVVGRILRPHGTNDLDRLFELVEPHFVRRKSVAIRALLVFLPTSTNPQDQPTP